jgi:hypothetical protein
MTSIFFETRRRPKRKSARLDGPNPSRLTPNQLPRRGRWSRRWLTAPGGFNDDEQGGEPIAEGEWEAVFQRPHPAGHEWAGDLDDSATAEAWGDTAPLAVSRAALLTTVDD